MGCLPSSPNETMTEKDDGSNNNCKNCVDCALQPVALSKLSSERPPLPRRMNVEGETRPQIVLFHSSFALNDFAHHIVLCRLAQLCPANRGALSSYLHGLRFEVLANSLINEEPSPILAKHGIKLETHERKRIEYLASLPEVIVTAPEDGDRKLERGERGAKRLGNAKGLLAPPERVSKVKREEGQKRRGERKRKAMELAAARQGVQSVDVAQRFDLMCFLYMRLLTSRKY
ncbi:hypothetical protein EK21DRAFT_108650 [Setomelanomma holmii]|uniref:Uncharacterized protein n=1 Tax=Setomelanomma holmii TaxID=210430 RepID=A0A9P4HIJ4_9PLEO|nr:hypothetical protein EK21DRAFT_108650 [Setomelanomma holmii]